MSDSVRVSLETDTEGESVQVDGGVGKVSAGDATFSFSIDGAEASESTRSESVSTAETSTASANSTKSGESTGTDESTESREPTNPRYVAPAAAVPTDSTLRCEVVLDDRSWEVILRRAGDEVAAWHNACPHRPEVRLDPGGGAIVDDDQVVCHDHGARFECGKGDDGRCTYGPCRGDALEAVEMQLRDGGVYLTDERFDACRRLE